MTNNGSVVLVHTDPTISAQYKRMTQNLHQLSLKCHSILPGINKDPSYRRSDLGQRTILRCVDYVDDEEIARISGFVRRQK